MVLSIQAAHPATGHVMFTILSSLKDTFCFGTMICWICRYGWMWGNTLQSTRIFVASPPSFKHNSPRPIHPYLNMTLGKPNKHQLNFKRDQRRVQRRSNVENRVALREVPIIIPTSSQVDAWMCARKGIVSLIAAFLPGYWWWFLGLCH